MTSSGTYTHIFSAGGTVPCICSSFSRETLNLLSKLSRAWTGLVAFQPTDPPGFLWAAPVVGFRRFILPPKATTLVCWPAHNEFWYKLGELSWFSSHCQDLASKSLKLVLGSFTAIYAFSSASSATAMGDMLTSSQSSFPALRPRSVWGTS